MKFPSTYRPRKKAVAIANLKIKVKCHSNRYGKEISKKMVGEMAND